MFSLTWVLRQGMCQTLASRCLPALSSLAVSASLSRHKKHTQVSERKQLETADRDRWSRSASVGVRSIAISRWSGLLRVEQAWRSTAEENSEQNSGRKNHSEQSRVEDRGNKNNSDVTQSGEHQTRHTRQKGESQRNYNKQDRKPKIKPTTELPPPQTESLAPPPLSLDYGPTPTLPQRLVLQSPPTLAAYMQLMRLDRPIGSWLLFWPCGWSLALSAAPGCLPDPWLMALFGVGAVVMRGAGCTINDMWDKNYDGKVARTASRPLASGRLSLFDALVFLGAQLGVGCFILQELNFYSICLGASSLGAANFFVLHIVNL